MITGGMTRTAGWKTDDAPLLAAVAAHEAADPPHPGQALTCTDQECRGRVDEALATTAERLPAKAHGRLFPR